MPSNLPYVTSPGTLKKMLERIQEASLPAHFNADFVETKLGMKGGSARSIIPFIKKMGFASTDGIPSDLYREYRNKSRSGYAIAKAMHNLFSDLFEVNDYAYDLNDNDLIGAIVQITGGEAKSTVTRLTLQTFKILKDFAKFDGEPEPEKDTEVVAERVLPQDQLMQYIQMQQSQQRPVDGINLSYTVNLNLPATSDIEVFNAIFKSLKEHLLSQ